ncbi:nuclear transport factor 2 family protein [Mycobacterium deserti]|uniref:Nuclear transport factor 2 family protein n=1 Tax=Mycobacterium deserti TaxID=2978347 RepID=A0ABT2MGI0_9MYCO|nr:nuclear transport factor 2 family protein [Mycobacterium deserti]MCT7661393.1 nuclear transport factor 2 family protein [Mycobacterium deserti]
MSMHDVTKRFKAALGELHENRDVEPLVELFGDDASLTKAGLPHGQHGKDGARTFWQHYREVFDSIEASFSHTVTDDGVAYLEWTSEGTLRDGTEFRYDGVSVLEGSEQGIDSFRTYYDTASFLSAEKRSALST